MSSTQPIISTISERIADQQIGWDAALRELTHQADHLEARGAFRAATTLFDAIRITRAGGLNCGQEHRKD